MIYRIIFVFLITSFVGLPREVVAASLDDVKDFCMGRIKVIGDAQGGEISLSGNTLSGSGSRIEIIRSGSTIDQLDFGEIGYNGCVERLSDFFGLGNSLAAELRWVCEFQTNSDITMLVNGEDVSGIDSGFISNLKNSLVAGGTETFLDRFGTAYVKGIDGRYHRHESEQKFKRDLEDFKSLGWGISALIILDFERASLEEMPIFAAGVEDAEIRMVSFVNSSLKMEFYGQMDVLVSDGSWGFIEMFGTYGSCRGI